MFEEDKQNVVVTDSQNCLIMEQPAHEIINREAEGDE
jgi:hypothetical protein